MALKGKRQWFACEAVRGSPLAAVGSLTGPRQSNNIPVGHRDGVTIQTVPTLERCVLPLILDTSPTPN
jgi:hypothetical protein